MAVAAVAVVLCGTLSCGGVWTSSRAGDERGGGFAAADRQRIDAIVEQPMSRSDTTGLSLAITHRGRLVFAKAYGYADRESREPLAIAHRFRIASVSKPSTAIEIMRLVERGRVRLDQRVFGEGSALGEQYGSSPRFADPRVEDITIQQLLEHTAGGWDNNAQDGTIRRRRVHVGGLHQLHQHAAAA